MKKTVLSLVYSALSNTIEAEDENDHKQAAKKNGNQKSQKNRKIQ